MRHFSVPDIIVDRYDYIYHAQMFNPKIYKYNKKGDLIDQIGQKPEYYRNLKVNDSEFSENNYSPAVSMKYNGKFSLTRSLWLLNENTIMINFNNTYNRKNNKDEEEGFMVMDLEGNDLIGEDILSHINFITAKDGFAYSFYDSTNTGKGFAAGPPSLKIYRYLPPAQ